MREVKPDGVIEIQCSGCCCPPGPRRRGQHTNATTTWWRATGSDWQPVRRKQHTRELAQAAQTCAEFVEALREESEDGA